MSAYACEPHRGSEPGVGWNIAKGMARHNDVWVMTCSRHRPAIEAELQKHPVPGLHFVYLNGVFDPVWLEKHFPLGINLHYYLWSIAAYRSAHLLHQKIRFNIAHHVTYVRYWMPSMAGLIDAPFIWGPVGGADAVPQPFIHDFSWSGQLKDRLRQAACLAGEHDPLVRLTARKALFGLATTAPTAERLRRLEVGQIKVLAESALSRNELDMLSALPAPGNSPLRFISLGRLLDWKAYHLSLHAFAAANLHNAEYWIAGDGPERKTLASLAQQLGIARKVKFWGWLPRAEALKKLALCHVFVHPSLRDSGGWACIEAMAASRPVICMDHAGPATQVTSETGFKVPVVHVQETVERMTEAMQRLASDPVLRSSMGAAGRIRVANHFSWERRCEEIDVLYRQAIGAGAVSEPLRALKSRIDETPHTLVFSSLR